MSGIRLALLRMSLTPFLLLSSGGLIAQEPPPPIETVPQYNLSAGVLHVNWENDAATSGTGPILDISRLFLGPAFVGAMVGTVPTEAGSDRVKARVYLLQVAVGLSPSFRVSDKWALVPIGGVAFGTTITDPEPADFGTRSQNTWSFSFGLRTDFGSLWSATIAFRRSTLDLERLSDSPSGSPTPTHANSLEARLGVRF